MKQFSYFLVLFFTYLLMLFIVDSAKVDTLKPTQVIIKQLEHLKITSKQTDELEKRYAEQKATIDSINVRLQDPKLIEKLKRRLKK